MADNNQPRRPTGFSIDDLVNFISDGALREVKDKIRGRQAAQEAAAETGDPSQLPAGGGAKKVLWEDQTPIRKNQNLIDVLFK